MLPQESLDLNSLYGLTEEQRQTARETARQNVIKRLGAKPARDQFDDHTGRQYPAYVVHTVTAIMLVLLIAFFSVSAMRLYTIGSDTFGERIAARPATMIAGIAIVIGSEAGALGFMLAAGVLAQDSRERRILYGLAFASTAIALVGNAQFALGAHWRSMILANPFAILEALLPPVVVLGGGLVFKRIWLDDIARHHANDRAYTLALAEYNALAASPDDHPDFRTVYMHALKQMIQAVNTNGGPGVQRRREIIAAMNGRDWRLVCEREIRADDWTRLELPNTPEPAPNAPQTHQDGQGEAIAIHEGQPYPLAAGLPIAAGSNHNGNGNGRNGQH